MSKNDNFDDLDFSGVEGSEDFEDIDFSGVEEPEDMSQLEAAARGAAQGLTFDFGDEIAGAGQAAVGALQGEEGSLKELYQKYRDDQRAQMEQAADEHPVTYYGSDIAAGVVPALLTGGASAVGSGVAALGKTAAKGALKKAVTKGALTGAATGAAVGLGSSKADLVEGEVLDAAKDTALGAGVGAGMGAAMPFAGKGLKKTGEGIKKVGKVLEQNIPGISSVKLGYEAGKRGITSTADGVTDAASDWAEKFHGKLVKVMNKHGIDKDQAIKLADEAGVKIKVGGDFDEVLNKMVDDGAVGMELKAKSKFYDELNSLKEGAKESKQFKKIEKKAIMDAAREKSRYDSKVVTTTEGSDKMDDLIPLAETEGKVDRITSKYVTETPEGKVEYFKSFFEADPEHAIKQIELDLNNLSPSDTNKLLKVINDNFVGDLGKKAANEQQRLARDLAGKVNKKLQDSVEGFADPNKTMHNIFGGARKMGVDKLYGGQEAVEDIQDTIAKKIRSSGPAADIDKRRAFDRFKKASPELDEVVEEGEFISKISDKVGSSEESGSVSAKGLVGAADTAVTRASNIAGKIVKSVQSRTAPVTKKIAKISDLSSDQITKVSEGMVSSEKPAIKAMGNQLTHALQQEDTVKNALLWSLNQQPAFRKSVERFIGKQDEAENESFEDIGFGGIEGVEEVSEPTEERVPFERPEEPTEERVPFGRPDEVSREPASVENNEEVIDTVLSDLDVKEGKGDLTGTAVTGNLGVTDSARKAVGTSEEWENAKTEEERDSIDEKTSREYLKKLHNDMPDSWKKAPRGVQEAMLDASYNIGPSMFGWKGVNAGMESGNWQEAATQLLDSANIQGKSSKGLAKRRAEAYNKIAKEANFAPIQKIEQEQDGTILYYNELGEEVFNYDPKGKSIHESSKPGIIELEDVETAMAREAKQLGSGAGEMGDQRSSLDDLMGKLSALQAPDSSEMQDAAYSGDMEGLQGMIDKYKGSIG